MKRYLISLLIISLFVSAQRPPALGQATDKIIYGGVALLKNVGRYNAANVGVGFSGRYQYPLTPTVSVTGKLGLEVYRVNYSFYNYSTYNVTSYNYTTGGYYSIPYYYNYSYENRGTAIVIPFSFGLRVYLTDKVHADLNVGVAIAVNGNATSDLRVEPGVGYTLPLGNGRFLDLNTSYFTSFARGSGAFTISAAYSLNLKN
ncbi:MAG: hypothetical protein H7Z72_18340 [Bacteroidetes bacterium]|nr:hypothetical protein [Fibrella sp.]